MNSVVADKENELDGAVFCNLESESHFMEAWALFTMLKAWRGLTSPLKIHTEVVLASHPYQKLCMSTPLESVLLHPDVVQGQASNGRKC